MNYMYLTIKNHRKIITIDEYSNRLIYSFFCDRPCFLGLLLGPSILFCLGLLLNVVLVFFVFVTVTGTGSFSAFVTVTCAARFFFGLVAVTSTGAFLFFGIFFVGVPP